MSAKLFHVFGFPCGISHGFTFHSNKSIVFLSGQICILHNLEKGQQKFVPYPGLQYPTALANGPKKFIAVADCGSRTQVTVYDVESSVKKVMPQPEIVIQEYVCMSFSSDFKYLAAQSGPPLWAMVVWTWDKKTLKTVYVPSQMQPNAEIMEICFHPRDNDQIVAVGRHYFRLYKYEGDEEGFKHFAFTKYEIHSDFLSLCWLPRERLAVGTGDGRILMFDGIEERYEIVVENPLGVEKKSKAKSEYIVTTEKMEQTNEQSKGDMKTENVKMFPIACLCTTSQGLFCAFGNNVVNEYVRTDDNKDYKFIQSIHLPDDSNEVQVDLGEVKDVDERITYIELNPAEDILAICTDRGQILQYNLTQAQVKKTTTKYFECVTQPVHKNAILSMDISIARSLIVSCSKHTIIFWDYMKRKSEMRKKFHDEILSMALHPLGLYLVVGFTEYTRIFMILTDGLKEMALLKVKNCTEVSFSHSGHLLAIANGSRIEIYNLVTLEHIALFKGHQGKLTSFGWSENDTIFISCDDKGAIYVWDMILKKRIIENVVKGTSYSAIAVLGDAEKFYAVGNDITIREFVGHELQKEVPTGLELTALSLSHSGRMFFGATESGCLRVFRFPLTAAAASMDSSAHQGRVTKVKIAINDDYLMTAGVDGMICLWKIAEKGKEEKMLVKYSSAVLIDQEVLRKHFAMIKDLKTGLNSIKVESQNELSLKDMTYKQQMKDISILFEKQISSLNSNIHQMTCEKVEIFSKYEEEIVRLKEKAKRDLNEMERNTREMLQSTYDHEDNLIKEFDLKEKSLRDEVNTLTSKNHDEVAALISSYTEQLTGKEKIINEQNEKIRLKEVKSKELWEQLEDEVDLEVKEVKSNFSRDIQVYKEEVERLQEANIIAKEKIVNQGKTISSLQEEIRRRISEEVRLKSVINELEVEIKETQNRVQNKNKTIQILQERLFSLNQDKHALEKQEYVATSCFDSLKKEIEPKNEEIAANKKLLVQLCNTVESLEKAAVLYKKEINALGERLRVAEKIIKKEKQKQLNLQTHFERLQADLYTCTNIIQDSQKLKNYVKVLMKKYLKDFKKETAATNFDLNAEFTHQREHLEKSIDVLRKRLLKENKTHRVEYVKMVQENSQLIKSINSLRQDLKLSQRRIRDMEAALGLTNVEFSVEGSATRQKLEMVVQAVRKNEEKTLEEIARKDDLIQMQQEEMRRLQVLAVVGEGGKKS